MSETKQGSDVAGEVPRPWQAGAAMTTILQGDCRSVLPTLPAESVQTCVTSPPYFGLRDYRVDGQIGLEQTPDAYVGEMVAVFREVRRVLRDDATLWLNLGDSYAGSGKGGNPADSPYQKQRTNRGSMSVVGQTARDAVNTRGVGDDRTYGFKPKDLIGIPWRVAFALQADGWWLRQDIIWHKPGPMPESVTDRCTKAHEYIFLLSKSARYYFDAEAIAEPAATAGKPVKMADGWDTGPGSHGAFHREGREKGKHLGAVQAETRNRRSVWTVPTKSYPEAHFATYPPKLIEPCILAGSRPGDTVLDPFNGSGTTGEVAIKHNRRYVGIELNPEYIDLTHKRISGVQMVIGGAA